MYSELFKNLARLYWYDGSFGGSVNVSLPCLHSTATARAANMYFSFQNISAILDLQAKYQSASCHATQKIFPEYPWVIQLIPSGSRASLPELGNRPAAWKEVSVHSGVFLKSMQISTDLYPHCASRYLSKQQLFITMLVYI